MADIQEVKISDIISDQAIQSRARIDQEAVADYAQNLDALPPILLFQDGDKLYLTEGFHRVAAHIQAKRAKVKAEIRKGTRDEAILHSAGANADNGVHRSAEDKRRAVNMLLINPEWAKKSARWLAQVARVSHELVNRIIEENNPGGRSETVGKDGKKRNAPAKRTSKATTTKATETPAEPKREATDRAGKLIKRAESQVLFGQAELFTAAKSAAAALKKQLVELADLKVGTFLDRQAIDDSIQSLYNIIESARPYTECPYCEGIPKPSCKVCRKTGIVSKQIYDTAIPIEIKEGAAATEEDKQQAKKSAEPKPEAKKADLPELDDKVKLKWKLNGKGQEKEFTEKTAAGLNNRFIDRNDKSRWVKCE